MNDDKKHDHDRDPGQGPRHRPGRYDDEQTRPGRSFPLLAPLVVAAVAGIILLLFVVIPNR